MRTVALISGGKDSSYNMMQCVAEGHEIVALANLHPIDKDELDSYMYQTVGHMGIETLAKAMELPLYRRETKGQCFQSGKQYIPTSNDEVEDLYALLECIKNEVNIEAVAVGAILSDYQRVRVENVCSRLNLISLSYLWRRDQIELLQEMIDCQVHAIIIKVAALGLVPDRHLGKSLREMQPFLLNIHDKCGLNVCGEGGEYETFTLDCPLFKKQIIVEDMQIVVSSSDPVCPVGYINFLKLNLKPKEPNQNKILIKTSLDYLSDLYKSPYIDISDVSKSEAKLELSEKDSTALDLTEKDGIILSEKNQLQEGTEMPFTLLVPKVNTEKAIESPFLKDSLNYAKFNCEALRNTPMWAINNGWMWIAGIQGCGSSKEDGFRVALTQLEEIVQKNSYELSDLCYITLYIENMQDYSILNKLYERLFNFINPPTRVCVQCPIPEQCYIVIEGVAYKSSQDINEERHTMHVQGISHWAPASIGPYSQSTRIGNITYISGQIGLIPGSMTIIKGGISDQCKLALRHISRIARAMNAQGQLRDVVQGICFLTHPSFVEEARSQWESQTTNAIMDYIVVPALPRGALAEWQVWIHSHNDKFDYEETGCSVDDYTISIRRRWNYENNCAAIVCYVSKGFHLKEDIRSTRLDYLDQTQDIPAKCIEEILDYVVGKLLKDYLVTKNCEVYKDDEQSNTIVSPITNSPHTPAIQLRVFYPINTSIKADLLLNSLNSFKSKINGIVSLVYTVLPVCGLHNTDTFLSICGIRHE